MSNDSRARRSAPVACVLTCLLAAGCAGPGRARQAEQPAPATGAKQPADVPVAAAPEAAPAAPMTADIAATAAASAPVEPLRPVPPAAPPRPAVKASAESAKPAPRTGPVKPPVNAAAAPAATPPPVRAASNAPVTGKPAAPPLDLAALETRLRETRAIGVFTKISLKNQVDDLLAKFRAYYKRQSKATLAELRRPYEMLLLKVLSLLQDSDPPLARDIVASREAIWGILSDPQKFNESNLMAGDTP